MSGAQPSSFLDQNLLFESAAGITGQKIRRNELLNTQAEQQIGAADIDAVSRASAAILGLKPEDRPAAYRAALRDLQPRGFARNAPPDYPGDPTIERLAGMGMSVENHFKQRRDLATGRALIGDVTPPAAGGVAPGQPAALAPFAARNLPTGVTPDEDLVVRTVYGEAASEPPEGQRAVAAVIGNRARQSGRSVSDVVFAPNQFEPWNNPATRAKLEGLDPASPEYQRILATVRQEGPDPTGGATHFYSPTAQAALGRQPPAWAQGQPTTIGGHQFYNLGYRGPQAAAGGRGADGSVQVAGPGVPTGGAAPAPAAGQLTPQQRQQLEAVAHNPALVVQLQNQFRDENTAAANTAYQRQRDAQTDTRQNVQLEIQQEQLRLSQQTQQIALNKAQREAADLALRGPTGEGLPNQDRRMLLRAYDNPDVAKTPEYAAAYANLAEPKIADGLQINPDMTPFKLPQDKDGKPILSYGQPKLAIGPGDLGKYRAIDEQFTTITHTLDVLQKAWENASATERAETLAGRPTPLRTAWTNAALLSKGDGLYQLGVISGPDQELLRGVYSDPTTFWGSLTSTATATKQIGMVKDLLNARRAAAQRAYGGGMGIGGPQSSTTAPPPPTNRPPLSSFQR